MQTPQKSNKSSQSNDDSARHRLKQSQLYSSKLSSQQQTISNSLKSSTKKVNEPSIISQQQLLSTYHSKNIKQQHDVMMVGSKSKLSLAYSQQKNGSLIKQKPIKTTVYYDGLKLSGYETRSRQNASNCLNQSLSENQIYDSNKQLIEDEIGYPYTMRADNQIESMDDEPTNLITQQHLSPTYSHQVFPSSMLQYQEDQVNLNIIESSTNPQMRRFSNSTEKVVTCNLNLTLSKDNIHNCSSGSLGIKQRRGRTQRKVQREKSCENEQEEDVKRELKFPDDNHEEFLNIEKIIAKKDQQVLQLQISETELNHQRDFLQECLQEHEALQQNPIVNVSTSNLADDTPSENKEYTTFNINSANTVDEFARSLLHHSYAKTPGSKRSSIEQSETSKSYINKILDIYYPKVSNNEESLSEPKIINTQTEQIQIQNPIIELQSPPVPQSPQAEAQKSSKVNIYSTDESEIDNFHPSSCQNKNNDQILLQKQQASNLNEDINMQLYGQISMFDQLTDYIENDNDEEQFSPQCDDDKNDCRGEDEESMDNGEDNNSNDLREYRQRINVLNEDIQSFIMDGGEDEGNGGNQLSSNPVHNLQVNTQCNEIFDDHNIQHIEEGKYGVHDATTLDFEQNLVSQMSPSGNIQESNIQQNQIVQKMNEQINQLLYQVSLLEDKVQSQNDQISNQNDQLHQLNKEKTILQDILASKKDNEDLMQEQLQHYQSLAKEQESQILNFQQKEQESNEKIELLSKENQVLRNKLASFFSVQQNQKALVSLEDKTNKNYSSPQSSSNIVFRKYQKNGTNKLSPKGPLNNQNSACQETTDNYSVTSSQQFEGKPLDNGRKSLATQKSLDASSSMGGKTLLDKILYNKSNEQIKNVGVMQQQQIGIKRQSLGNNNAKLTTPQKPKTGQRLGNMIGSSTGGKNQINSSGQKNHAKVKETLSPKGSKRCENMPKSYYYQ